MGPVGIGVADTLNKCEVLLLPGCHEWLQLRIETHLLRQCQHVVSWHCQGPQPVIGPVGIRHDGVQAIVIAAQLDQNQDLVPSGRPRLVG